MADKAEVTIMHLIFDRFHTFVDSLNNIEEMNESITESNTLIFSVRKKFQIISKELKAHYLRIPLKIKKSTRKKQWPHC